MATTELSRGAFRRARVVAPGATRPTGANPTTTPRDRLLRLLLDEETAQLAHIAYRAWAEAAASAYAGRLGKPPGRR
jgi:hypothetical protein